MKWKTGGEPGRGVSKESGCSSVQEKADKRHPKPGAGDAAQGWSACLVRARPLGSISSTAKKEKKSTLNQEAVEEDNGHSPH